jgi:UDP-GlcNAc:undecaprenyl-phosphate GlcNAc-1-phosphate transferase
VAIFLGFTISCITWSTPPESSIIFLVLPVLIIPFIIGLFDDLIQLKPAAKIIAQAITACLVFFVLDIRLTSLYGMGGAHEFPLLLSFLLTLLTVIVITNSLNLIDGIDGLAATFSFMACAFFGIWFFFAGQYPFSVLCFALAGAILAFLFQNWEPSNIFMGDTGSLVIGTGLSVIMIQFINQNYSLNVNHPLKFNSSIGAAVCVMIIPLADTMRIIIIRLYHRVSPLMADKRHIHHALVKLGFSHRQTVYILALVHISMISIAILFRNANQWLLIGIVFCISLSLSITLNRLLLKLVRKET